MKASPKPLRSLLVLIVALSGCGGGQAPPSTTVGPSAQLEPTAPPERSAQLELTVTPDPIMGVPDTGGDRRFDFVVHVRETGGVGGTLDRISELLEIPGVSSTPYIRTVNRRLEAYGADSLEDTFWVSPPHKLTQLTLSVQFTDDLGHVLARSVVVSAVEG